MLFQSSDIRKSASVLGLVSLTLVLFLPSGWAGSAQDQEITPLVQDLEKGDWKVRQAAVLALGWIAGESHSFQPQAFRGRMTLV